MKVSVAYEGKSQKPKVKQLKWHIGNRKRTGANRYLIAQGVKGVYRIERQKPNRRVGIFKWLLMLDNEPAVIDVKGTPMSLDDLTELKAFASSYDAIPSGTVIAVNEPPAGGRANESPTREEWEVVVHHAPSQYKNSILSMVGPGDGFEAGNKLILQGFHDDGEASNVAASIVKRYKVPVTTGPIRKLPPDEANEEPRRRTDEERRYPLKWTDTPKGNSFAHGVQGDYYVVERVDGWGLSGPNAVNLGTFR